MSTYDVGTVTCQTTMEMIQVVAGFVREGVTFKCHSEFGTGVWVITLTGGY